MPFQLDPDKTNHARQLRQLVVGCNFSCGSQISTRLAFACFRSTYEAHWIKPQFQRSHVDQTSDEIYVRSDPELAYFQMSY